MLRIALAIVLTVIVCASGKSDLKSGYDALRRHDHDKAIAHFTDAIKSGDLSRANLALAYHYRGADCLNIDRPDEALADPTQAIAIEPQHLPTAYSDRGIAHRRKGDCVKAIADYSEAIRLWPDWHDWYLNRGIAYAASGHYEDAIAGYTKALYHRPDLASAMGAYADAHLRQGRKTEAPITDAR